MPWRYFPRYSKMLLEAIITYRGKVTQPLIGLLGICACFKWKSLYLMYVLELTAAQETLSRGNKTAIDSFLRYLDALRMKPYP